MSTPIDDAARLGSVSPCAASSVGDAYSTLNHVADAAVDGQVHGGPLGALSCAAIAALGALTDAPKEDAHKQDAPAGHKQHLP